MNNIKNNFRLITKYCKLLETLAIFSIFFSIITHYLIKEIIDFSWTLFLILCILNIVLGIVAIILIESRLKSANRNKGWLDIKTTFSYIGLYFLFTLIIMIIEDILLLYVGGQTISFWYEDINTWSGLIFCIIIISFAFYISKRFSNSDLAICPHSSKEIYKKIKHQELFDENKLTSESPTEFTYFYMKFIRLFGFQDKANIYSKSGKTGIIPATLIVISWSSNIENSDKDHIRKLFNILENE